MVLHIYDRCFHHRPYATLVVVNGTLSVIGDFCAQSLSPSPGASYDFPRTLRFLVFGMAMGPLSGWWNHFLEHRFPLRAEPLVEGHLYPLSDIKVDHPPSPSSPTVADVGPGAVSPALLARRILVDQLIMAPLTVLCFLLLMGIMEGRSLVGISDKISTHWFSLLVANWKIWPIVVGVMFLYILLKFRVPVGSGFGVLWTVYLSLVTGAS